MTSHSITIAKASFAAACLRPDVTHLTREDISRFHSLLETAVLKCTPSNIQTCKEWLLENVVLSAQRTVALGKYLVATSKFFKSCTDKILSGRTSKSINRQRLHILYVLNDILHHIKYHSTDSVSLTQVVTSLQGQIPELFELARSDGKRMVHKRLDDLLLIWENEQYFDKDVLDQLSKGVAGINDATSSKTNNTTTTTSTKVLPYIMPATHGDPSLPYYDLPAANLMPHIVPNRSVPIRPGQIRALQLSSGPADEGLINAVKDFLKDVEHIDNPYQLLEQEGINTDVDELGQISYHDETDDVMVDTYYGWSKTFCEKMKKRITGEDGDRKQDRSRSYSRSPDRSRSSSRSRGSKRRRDTPRSQSPLPRHHFQHRSNSQSPDWKPASFQHKHPSSAFSRASNQLSPAFNAQHMIYPPFPPGSNSMPVPPRPPNYQGLWPPPPPPPPHPPPPPSHGYSDIQFPPKQQFSLGSSESAYFYHHNSR